MALRAQADVMLSGVLSVRRFDSGSGPPSLTIKQYLSSVNIKPGQF